MIYDRWSLDALDACQRDRPRLLHSTAMAYLYIALFSVAGAFARYMQSAAVQRLLGREFPFATLSINVLGSFLMGSLFFVTLERVTMSPALRTGILTGGLGAYTTFSTFSLETLNLLEGGEVAKAVAYMTLSVILGVAAAMLGAYMARNLGVQR